MSNEELEAKDNMAAYREKSRKCGMNYKELIIALLDKIDNTRFLKAIYISMRDYVKESEGME